MQTRIWDRDAECAPLAEFARRMEARLAATDLFVRAARSPLYRERWQAAGVDPAAVRSYAGLQCLPYTGAADLRRAQAEHPPDAFVCSPERPRLWVSTSGSTGVPKWVPIGAADLELARQVGFRLATFGGQPARRGESALIVVAPAPFISDTSVWPGLVNELRGDGPQGLEPAEDILFSYEDGVAGVGMALKRRASIVLAFPSLAMRIAEGLAESAPALARRSFREKPGPLTLLALLVTRLRRLRPRDLLRTHSGVFAGEPLDPYRAALREAWGFKWVLNAYTFSEYQVGLAECGAMDGIHVWLDVSLPEIILQADLDRERDEGRVPPARPLWEAQPGDEGELVLTHFGDAFPLVRWRTSDLVRVVGVDPCRCGRTLPRVNFLQRSDDLVNLGILRISTFEIKAALDAVAQPAAVARWQLRVGRQGYKPLLTVLARPAAPAPEAEMAAAVRAALDRLEVLRLAVENGLVCAPVVRIVPDLEDRLSTSGKFRPLVYETDPAPGGTS